MIYIYFKQKGVYLSMNFSKNIKTFFHKLDDWNEKQKQMAKQKQPQLQQKLDAEKNDMKKLIKQIPSQLKSVDSSSSSHTIQPQSNTLGTLNIQLEVQMFSTFSDDTTQSPFEEMYYANHKEYGVWEKEYIPLSSRFQSKQCPYCQKTIEKLSARSRICPHCKGKLVITKNICSQEHMLLSQEEFQPLYQERLSIDWDRYTAEAEFYLKRRDYGLYRNAKHNLLETGFALHKFPPYELLVKCFELYYLDFSGPNNVHGLSSSICPPFEQDTLIPPAVLDWVESAIENYPQSLEQYEQIFLTEIEKIRLPEQKTLPKTVWNRLKKDVKEILDSLQEQADY